ncbi:MAG: hypothetical protein HKO65_15720, partial [Gemmatimonadetes bacterium]|nr:hypothetical protein [Gemmatimonadota bacterium]
MSFPLLQGNPLAYHSTIPQNVLCHRPSRRERSMMIGKLVALIEDHADELTARMVRLVRENPMTAGYGRFDDEELGGRARFVYANLGQW